MAHGIALAFPVFCHSLSLQIGLIANLTGLNDWKSLNLPQIAIDYTAAYEQGAGIGRYVRELVAHLAQEDSNTPYRLFVAGAKADNLPIVPADNFSWKPTRISPIWLTRIGHRLRFPLPIEVFTGSVDLYHATDFVLPPTRINSFSSNIRSTFTWVVNGISPISSRKRVLLFASSKYPFRESTAPVKAPLW